MKRREFCLTLLFLLIIIQNAISQSGIPDNRNKFKPVILVKANHESNPGDSIERNIVTVLQGNGSTSTSGRAPQGSRRYINTKYIISGAEMTASGFGSGIVSSIGWNWLNSTASQNISTTGTIKVYLKDTAGTAVTLTFPQNFNTLGMTKVIDTIFTIPAFPLTTPFSIDIPAGGSGTSPFTIVNGNSVIVAFEYQTTSALAIPTGAPTVHCNPGLPNSLGTYQSQTANGTLLAASSFRPETRFGNSSVVPFEVMSVYSSGKIPWEWGFDYDTSVLISPLDYILPVSVNDRNGFAMRRNQAGNFPIVVTISIYNTNGAFKGSQRITFNSLTPYIVKTYNNVTYDVTHYTARNKTDRVIVQAAKGDRLDIPGSEGGYTSEKEICRFVNCDSYNYADYCQPDDGGFGFNGTSGFLVAGFTNYSQNHFPVYAIDHYFYNPTSMGNQPYRLVIYSEDGNRKPGNLLYVSPVFISPAGNFNRQKVIHELNSPVNIPGLSRFFIGWQQTSAVNIGAGFQSEDPIRDSTFYYSYTGSINSWTDFSDDSVSIRMDISPRTARSLILKAYLEGFFNGTSMTPDTVNLQIRNSVFPYNIIDTGKTILNSNGEGNFNFLKLGEIDSSNCFFVLKHRNHIETWSHSSPENFNECNKYYDFTDSLSKAYGNNMLYFAGSYVIYGGDANQDDVVDGFDAVLVDNDAAEFTVGYYRTDINGDGIVDANDALIVDNNAANFVSAVFP